MTDWGITFTVFLSCFAITALLGFAATKWKRGHNNNGHIEEWGLGGRNFGAWITWFLIGGDFYSAYTIIAVPALIYAVGAYGFFALPYTILVYPFIFLVMPPLWRYAKLHHHVTSADVVQHRFASPALALCVAVTGFIATMPYIALQMVGMGVIFKHLGLHGHMPVIISFVILGIYTYISGLRAPALIAFIKDLMIYVIVIVTVVLIPVKLGGYANIFNLASEAFNNKAGAGLLLEKSQTTAYITLAVGSALAAFMYPHTLTGIFAAKSDATIRKNAIFLPAYTLLLGLLALLGYAVYAAGLHISDNNDSIPQLLAHLFPSWFVGFAFAAIAIGALVPASVMGIGAANLFTRNFWKQYVNPNLSGKTETNIAKLGSLIVLVGALGFILFLPLQYALNLQLLGGIWIMQILPALLFGLFTNFFNAKGLLPGWLVGIVLGTYLVYNNNLTPLQTIDIFGTKYQFYIGILALIVNIIIATLISLFTKKPN